MGGGDIERELRIKATGDTADAKASVADLKTEVVGLSEAQDAHVQAQRDYLGVTAQVNAEEARASAVLSEHTAALFELDAAQKKAAAAVAAMAEAATAGGRAYQVAIDNAAAAVARLEIAQESVRARGGPIPPAAIAELGAYDAAVQAAATSTAGVGKALNVTNLEMNVARGSVGGLARSLGALSEAAGPALAALGKAGLAGLVIAEGMRLAIAGVEGIAKAWDFATGKIASFLSGMNDAAPILDKHGKQIDTLSDEYQKAADAQAFLTRETAAMSAGIIAVTEDTKKAAAEEIIREAALHRITVATTQYVAALHEFGIKAFESFSDAKAAGDAFFTEYERALRAGPAVARAWAEENKAALEKILDGYVLLGREIPPKLQAIATSLGVVSKAESDLAKNEELQKKTADKVEDLKAKYAELTKAQADSIKSFKEHSDAIEAHRKVEVAAIEQTTAKTVASLQEQVTATNKAYAERKISDTDYNTSINRLFAEQAIAKQRAYEAERAIDEKARKDQAELADKFAIESRKRVDALNDTKDAEAAAEARLKSLNAEIFNQVQALATVKPRLLEAGVAAEDLDGKVDALKTTTKGATDAQIALWQELARSGGIMADLGGQVDALTAKFGSLAAAAAGAASAVASVTEGTAASGSGGGGGGAF